MPETVVSLQLLTSIRTALADRYVVEREIARGGMGTVYLARDLQTDHRVAVKVLLPDLAASIGAERFLREIEVESLLDHPNIVGVLDSGTADGQLYFVMPYVEGESLRDRLERERQLPFEDALAITREVAAALTHAHARGIIHRDIKPENILLERDHVWLTDFGIARALSVAGGEKLTKTGVAVGTPAYMSPEQAAGSHDVTAQSDIYSLACVVYEMLAGEPPFTGPTAMAILARHSLDSVRSLKIVRSATPDAVEDALLCALEKVPADRFATVQAFADALAGTAPVPNRAARRARQGRAPPAPRFSRRALALALVLALGVVSGASWLGWQHWHRPTAASRFGTDSDPRHLAVLYFSDETPGKPLQYLADGFTDALIHELSTVRPLTVISRNGVLPFKGATVAPDSIGRALRVGTLVTGSVAQRSRDHLRVEITLRDALTGDVIGRERIDEPRGAVLAVRDSLAQEVAFVLRKRLGQEVEGLRGQAGTRNARAWEELQRARQAVAAVDPLIAEGKVQEASQRFAAADTELAGVAVLDPAWGAPVVQRGWVAYRQSRLLGTTDPSGVPRWIDAGMAQAAHALELDPSDPDALELRGTLRYWRWLLNLAPDPAASKELLAGAEADLRAATEANPMQATAWNSLSHLLLAKSQTTDAKIAASRAYEADPYLTDVDKTIWRLFQSSLDLNQPTEAAKWCGVGERRFPGNYRFTECRLWLYALEGQTPNVPEVWRTYAEYVQRSPTTVQAFDSLKGGMMVALALVRAGLPDSADAVIRRSRTGPRLDPAGELTYLEALARVQLGQKSEAIQLLARYYAANPQQRALARYDESWWLNGIRDDPRYRALIRGND